MKIHRAKSGDRLIPFTNFQRVNFVLPDPLTSVNQFTFNYGTYRSSSRRLDMSERDAPLRNSMTETAVALWGTVRASPRSINRFSDVCSWCMLSGVNYSGVGVPSRSRMEVFASKEPPLYHTSLGRFWNVYRSEICPSLFRTEFSAFR